MISPMPEITVIADTSCLIALTNINALDLLKNLYTEVIVSDEIALEYGEPLPPWIKIETVKNLKYLQILENLLDRGEASAIAIALDLEHVLLILDDLKARKIAEKLGFKITGTLGILIKARKSGLITQIKPYLEQLKTIGFRISNTIEDELLRLCDE
jgi:predicted nucleic acid-binding protein